MICQPIAYRPPVEIAERLHRAGGFVFLDGGGDDPDLGRYSFIGVEPFGTFVIDGGQAFWDGTPLDGAPMARLAERLDRYRLEPTTDPDAPPLRAGAIGHLSYDLGRLFEVLAPPAPAEPHATDLRLGFYDLILAFDRREKRAWLCSSGFPETAPEARAARAEARARDLVRRIAAPAPPPTPTVPVDGWRSNFTEVTFCKAVRRVQEHIRAGDIYQANLAQRFEAPLPHGFDPWAFYRVLRRVNPAPFAAFLSDGETTIASSSPERFLNLRDGLVEARPIKGTIARSADPDEDRARAAALLASPKDRAENVMIVDLLRNDLSRVCAPGSVEVPVLCGLESYAAVHHLTSVVRGRLRPGLGATDLIAACFPGGSITGAPKIRAMDVITSLETVARGVYCGAIGYLGFDGTMNLNIAIRTAVLGRDRAVVQAGGGITLLSDPAAEYAETLVKADRLFAAFAGRG